MSARVARLGRERPGARSRAVPTPEDVGLRRDAPLPSGTRIRLDPSTARFGEDVLFGGSPPRILRLAPSGVEALTELQRGPVASTAAGVLGRRLCDAGLAQPLPASPAPALSVTAIVPVRDRPEALQACLGALAGSVPVVVVDDGSQDAKAIAEVCSRRECRLLRRPVAGGPAVARNDALGLVESDVVAFVDSDCLVPPGWLEGLLGHFTDPLVAAVAPRVRAAQDSLASPLDRGDRPAGVAPLTSVSFVPTAALVVKRQAVGQGFDQALRYGEDVDLVWRLVEAGWRVRYEPSVEVRHLEPDSLVERVGRRAAYGRSVGPLEVRHPGNLVHLVLAPGPAVVVGALLARRPLTALAGLAATVALLHRRLAPFGLRRRDVVGPVAAGVAQTWLGLGRWAGQFAWPLLVALLVHPGGRRCRTRWGRRLAVASLLLGPWAAEQARVSDGPASRARAAVEGLVEQAAYGTGVVAGCWRSRRLAPLLPRVTAINSRG